LNKQNGIAIGERGIGKEAKKSNYFILPVS